MNFWIRWAKAAVNELTDLWLQADSNMRQRITKAADQVDRELIRDPIGKSESRANGRRIAFFPPLGVTFRIEADGKTVTLLHVWLFRKRARP